MAKNKETVKLAKQILAYVYFDAQVDPDCTQCSGSGEYEEVSGHNGDFYMTTCPCKNRNRPPEPSLDAFDDALLRMARYYLKK